MTKSILTLNKIRYDNKLRYQRPDLIEAAQGNKDQILRGTKYLGTKNIRKQTSFFLFKAVVALGSFYIETLTIRYL